MPSVKRQQKIGSILDSKEICYVEIDKDSFSSSTDKCFSSVEFIVLMPDGRKLLVTRNNLTLEGKKDANELQKLFGNEYGLINAAELLKELMDA